MSVTLAELKVQLGVDAADTTQDAALTQMLGQALAIASRESRLTFGQCDVVEYYEGRNTPELALRGRPVVAVSEVRLACEHGGHGNYGGDQTLWDDDSTLLVQGEDWDYHHSDSTAFNGQILYRLKGKWWPARHDSPVGRVAHTEQPGIGNVRVSYTIGTGDNMPADIKGAVMQVVAAIRDVATTGGRTLSNKSIDYVSFGYSGNSSGGSSAAGGPSSLPIENALRIFSAYKVPYI